MKKLNGMNFSSFVNKLTRNEMRDVLAGRFASPTSVGCGENCGSNGVVCNSLGTCSTCGPECTCI